MNVRDPDSPVRRMTIAIAVAVAIMVAAALVYVFLVSKETSAKFNGAAIVEAARAYTRDLQARKEPVPKSVTLEDLVARHFLKPEEIAAFRGLNATIMLTSNESNPQTVLMRVHFPDGGDILLLGDGSVRQAAR
jgi:flagellar basal body-associated protein FliL